MVTITAAQVSTRTTAACSVCEWTSERLTRELPVRTAARLHIGVTGHSVLLLTNTVTVLEQLPATSAIADPAWPHPRPVKSIYRAIPETDPIPVSGPDSAAALAGFLGDTPVALNGPSRVLDPTQVLPSINSEGRAR